MALVAENIHDKIQLSLRAIQECEEQNKANAQTVIGSEQRKIKALEKKYDEQFAVVFEAIKELITPPEPPKKQIGFHP